MKQRLIITEEEKNQIINLHRKFINEAGPGGIDPNLQQGNTTTTTTVAPVTTTTTTVAPVTTTTTTVAPVAIQKGVKNPKVETLQNKLNEKFKSGLTPDGKWGPKTAAAVQTALASLQGAQQPNASTQPLQKPTTDYAKQFQQNAQNIINQNPFRRTN